MQLHVVGSWQDLWCCDAYGDLRLLQMTSTNSSSGSSSGNISGNNSSGNGSGDGSQRTKQLLRSIRASHKDNPLGEPRALNFTETWGNLQLKPCSQLLIEAEAFQGMFPSLWVQATLRYAAVVKAVDSTAASSSAGAAAAATGRTIFF